MSGLMSVSIRYVDRQLILENPNDEDIDLEIRQGQLFWDSHVYTDAGIVDNQLLVEVDVAELIFEIHDNQLWFYNLANEDIDFYLDGNTLVATSEGYYTDAFIKSHQVFIVSGIEIDFDNLDPATMANIHEALMAPSRQTFGVVKIYYYNPLLEVTNFCIASSEGPGSSLDDVLKDNDRGWISEGVSDADGWIDETLAIEMSPRLLGAFSISFGDDPAKYAQEFVVTINNGTDSITRYITNYADTIVKFNEDVFVETGTVIVDATELIINIRRMSAPNLPAQINYVDIQQPFYYEDNQLIGVDILEELTYTDAKTHLGALSANEVNVYLNNELHSFDFNNEASRVSRQLKKNRKIAPYLGINAINPETDKETLYWIPCGVFWAYNWNVNQNKPITTLQGFDTLWLLNQIDFKEFYMQKNISLADFLTYVLEKAQAYVTDLRFMIDPDLDNINFTIPWGVINKGKFFQVLQEISGCYPIDIYCDRSFRIACMCQHHINDHTKLHWSNSDIILGTEYPTLYTDKYNIITVKIYDAVEITDKLVSSVQAITITDETKITLNFNGYCTNTELDPPTLNIVKDENVTIKDYTWYEWGCDLTFTGSGTVESITVNGSYVTLQSTTFVQSRDEEAIFNDGELEITIDNIYIQSYDYAKYLADLMLEQVQSLKFNAEVSNRGDFLATLNDKVHLTDGLAYDYNNYKITKQNMKWDGSLTCETSLLTDVTDIEEV